MNNTKYEVSVEVMGENNDRVHVAILAPDGNGVDFHWYPTLVDFNRDVAYMQFGREGFSLSDRERAKVVDQVSMRSAEIGLTFPDDEGVVAEYTKPSTWVPVAEPENEVPEAENEVPEAEYKKPRTRKVAEPENEVPEAE